MQTKQHCNEDAITAYLLGMADREDANHVDACLDCYARVERARIEDCSLELWKQALDVNLTWQVQRHVTVQASYVHFLSGTYVHAAGGSDVNYFSTTISFLF